MGALAAKKDALVAAWLARTIETYPERTCRFLIREQDPFRNPVGHTLKGTLPPLFDQLLGAMDAGRLTTLLDGIVRVRAVQDFTASEAVAFIFLLKKVIREQWSSEGQESPGGNGLSAVDGRIDEMALLAFDLFMRCREHMGEIKANDARRRTHLLERMQARTGPRP
jgi:hypothetical protein